MASGATEHHTGHGGDKPVCGVVGVFDTPEKLVQAMRQVRERKYESFDAFTPFPIHGLDDVQGLKRSILPYITFGAGLTGASLGFLLQYWTSAVDWPLIVGGKPFNSWPAFVPIMFESTVLFAGIFTVLGMIFLNRLPKMTRALGRLEAKVTTDQFALCIGKGNGRPGFKTFDEHEASQYLRSLGAQEVKTVYREGWFS